PKLNLRNSEVKQYLFDLVKYWIVNFDIDGFKVLNPQEMDQQFLAELMQLVHGLKANFCLMSETNSLTPALINNSALDTAIDDDLVEIMLNYFIAKKTNVSEMITALNDDLMKYPTTQQKSMMIQFDGPNDPRLLSLCDDDEQLSRLLLAFTYLLPLSPSLYYGTEYGLKGGQVPANRECMPWKASEQDQTMYRFIKLLGEFRNKYSLVLNDGSLDWGQTSNKNDYLSFTRSSNGKRIFALFNVGYGSIKFIFPPKAKLILSQNLVKDQNRIGHNGFVIVEA
ncbi:MAG TPA: neopullulanase/cyclomaltodextrinase/maltogenic alpha-amylase, partial [Candidatus Ligilactobacillus excrementavium]|nr:neopullulanase/cyclomaltodextrinase/maltogenic alpha-amylase [Candidatus Ligilactobacillus excrementavium]